MYRLLLVLLSQHFLLDESNIFANAIFGEDLVKVTNFLRRDKYPYVASIVANRGRDPDNDHFCTGVLISRKHVLTSAQCRKHMNVDTRVYLGSDILEDGKRYKAISFMTYATWEYINDKDKEFTVIDEDNNVDLGVITLGTEVDRSIAHARFTKRRGRELYNAPAYSVGWSANRMADNKRHKYMGRFRTIDNYQLDNDETDERLSSFLQMEPRDEFLGTMATEDVYLNEGDCGSPLLDQDDRLVAIFSNPIVSQNDIYSPSTVYVNTIIYPHYEFINHFIYGRGPDRIGPIGGTGLN